jgi:hypothetical protein
VGRAYQPFLNGRAGEVCSFRLNRDPVHLDPIAVSCGKNLTFSSVHVPEPPRVDMTPRI